MDGAESGDAQNTGRDCNFDNLLGYIIIDFCLLQLIDRNETILRLWQLCKLKANVDELLWRCPEAAVARAYEIAD